MQHIKNNRFIRSIIVYAGLLALISAVYEWITNDRLMKEPWLVILFPILMALADWYIERPNRSKLKTESD
jgi:predicted ABC-type sugar transport system permease subunit